MQQKSLAQSATEFSHFSVSGSEDKKGEGDHCSLSPNTRPTPIALSEGEGAADLITSTDSANNKADVSSFSDIISYM